MRFLEPILFYSWVPLVLVPIVLYLFRPRPRTVRTSTLPFFKWLAREHQDSTWLKWLKHLLSLLLSILVIVAGAAALGRLVVAPPAESMQMVVILLDRSASMAARVEEDGEDGKLGKTRLEEAIELAKTRLDGLQAGVEVTLIAYDQRAEVLLSRSLDHRRARRALATVEVRPTEGDAAAALQLARRIASLKTPARIWHFTDALPPAAPEPVEANADLLKAPEPAPDATDSPPEEENEDAAAGQESPPTEEPAEAPDDEAPDDSADVEVDHVRVALRNPINAGITAFSLRPTPMERGQYDVFVQVRSACAEPIEATLEVTLDDKLVEIREMELEPGVKHQPQLTPVAAVDADRVMRLHLKVNGDVLPTDDVVYAKIPRRRPVRILWITESPDPFTELALTTLGERGEILMLQGGPANWPPPAVASEDEQIKLVIFDGWLPPEWPSDVPVVVIDPPGSSGPIRAAPIAGGGLPLDALRAPGEGHLVLFGVATGRLTLRQTVVFEAGGQLQPLLTGLKGPVLVAGEVGGQRIVAFGFSPQRSERLPLMSSYPLLIGNAIYWAAQQQLQAAEGMNFRTGELMKLDGENITWHDPDAEESRRSVVPLTGQTAELDRVGLWETDAGQAGSASLLSSQETLIASPDEDTEDVAAATAWWLRGDLTPWLLWGVFGLLIVESWMFHRYLAY